MEIDFSSRPTISLIQSTDVWCGNDLALAWLLDWPRYRGVTLKREMGTNGVIIFQVRGHQPSQMGLVEHNDSVKKLSA